MMCWSGPDVLSKIYVPKNILPDSFPPTSAHVEFFVASSSICGIRQRAGFAGARGPGPGTETKRCTQRSQSNLWRRICDSGAFEPLEHTMFKRLFSGFSIVFGIFTMCCASFSVFPGWLIYSTSRSFSHFRRCSMDVYKKFSGQPQSSTHFFILFSLFFSFEPLKPPASGRIQGAQPPSGCLALRALHAAGRSAVHALDKAIWRREMKDQRVNQQNSDVTNKNCNLVVFLVICPTNRRI